MPNIDRPDLHHCLGKLERDDRNASWEPGRFDRGNRTSRSQLRAGKVESFDRYNICSLQCIVLLNLFFAPSTSLGPTPERFDQRSARERRLLCVRRFWATNPRLARHLTSSHDKYSTYNKTYVRAWLQVVIPISVVPICKTAVFLDAAVFGRFKRPDHTASLFKYLLCSENQVPCLCLGGSNEGVPSFVGTNVPAKATRHPTHDKLTS